MRMTGCIGNACCNINALSLLLRHARTNALNEERHAATQCGDDGVICEEQSVCEAEYVGQGCTG